MENDHIIFCRASLQADLAKLISKGFTPPQREAPTFALLTPHRLRFKTDVHTNGSADCVFHFFDHSVRQCDHLVCWPSAVVGDFRRPVI